MGKTRPITETDIEKAKEIQRRFGGVNLHNVGRNYHEEIIQARYGDVIRGSYYSQMSDRQIYRIAESIISRSARISRLEHAVRPS